MNASNTASVGRTALVLAGGGLLGASYEMGALAALDAALADYSATDFEIIVGTSAGATIGACLANGMRPAAMIHALANPGGYLSPPAFADVFALDTRSLLTRGLGLPQALLNAVIGILRTAGSVSLFDLLDHLGNVLPSGFYDGRALERYLAAALRANGMTDSFRALSCELAIIATDLDSAERVVFSAESRVQVPISRAVAASSAVPLLYKPVRINGRDYIDGGVRGNASLDIAVERGARLIICINPLVPLHSRQPIAEQGAGAVGAQTFRAFAHAQLHYHIKHLRAAHPEVNIVLIEPARDDATMFAEGPMRYSSRLRVAQHAQEQVTQWLDINSDTLAPLFARHGLTLDPQPAEWFGTQPMMTL